MSPLRFLRGLAATGVLKIAVNAGSKKRWADIAYEGKLRGSESDMTVSSRLRAGLSGEELGNAIGDELPAVDRLHQSRGVDCTGCDLRAKRGVLLGVAIPTALLAINPLNGVLSGALDARGRTGVPAIEGVPGKKRGKAWGLGALGMDGSMDELPVPFSISTSSEEGKSRAGGEDMMGCGGHRCLDASHRANYEFRAGFITFKQHVIASSHPYHSQPLSYSTDDINQQCASKT